MVEQYVEINCGGSKIELDVLNFMFKVVYVYIDKLDLMKRLFECKDRR